MLSLRRFVCFVGLIACAASAMCCAAVCAQDDPGTGHRPWWPTHMGVNLYNGNLTVSYPFGSGCAGCSDGSANMIPFTLSYNSHQQGAAGGFGPGWMSTLDTQAEPDPYGDPYCDLDVLDCNGTHRDMRNLWNIPWHTCATARPAFSKESDKLEYDPDENPPRFEVFRRDGTTWRFTSYGNPAVWRVTEIQDRNPEVQPIQIGREADGRLLSVTDPQNRGTVYEWTGDHITAVIQLPNLTGQAVWELSYWPNDGPLRSVVNPEGAEVRFYYNPQGLLSQVSVPLIQQQPPPGGGDDDQGGGGEPDSPTDKTTSYYYENGKVVRIVDPEGEETQFSYGENTTTVTDRRDNQTTYVFDDYGRVTSVTDGLGKTTYYAWDDDTYELTTVTDARDPAVVTYLEYDWDYDGHHLTTRHDDYGGPKETVTSYDYDYEQQVGPQVGLDLTYVIRDVGGLNLETQYDYDANGDLTDVWQKIDGDLQRFVHNEYDDLGRLTLTQDGAQWNLGHGVEGPRTQYEYSNGVDLPTAIVEYDRDSQPMRRTEFEYDQRGRRLTATVKSQESGDRITQYSYDDLDRLTEIHHQDGSVYYYDYSCCSLDFVADENGNRTHYFYDLCDRLTEVCLPGNPSPSRANPDIKYVYDPEGNRTEVRNKRNGQWVHTDYAYDEVNRLRQITYPGPTTESYTYDPVGNRLTRTDGLGRVTTYTHDNLNRLTTIHYPLGADTVYDYDNAGRRTSMTDATGVTDYDYDGADRLTGVTYPWGPSVGYILDNASRRQTMTLSAGGSGVEWGYGYFDNGQLETVTNTYGETTGYGYYDWGALKTATLGNGTVAEYAYTGRDFLESVTNRFSAEGDIICSFTYDYTDEFVGNRRGMDCFTRLLADPWEDNWYVGYDYDDLYRLTSEDSDGHLAGDYSRVYTYDEVGNRLTMAVDGGDPIAYSYDNANKMQSAGTTTFIYDNNGNTLIKTVPGIGLTRYVYNCENKITAILSTGGGGSATYAYDGDGVRRKKTDAGGVRRFVYDGANVIAETDDNGNLQVVNTYGVDGLVSSRAAGQSHFYHFDGLGSTRAMTNAQAQLVEVYDYEAFGNQLLAQGGLATPYRYVGQLGYYRHDDVELDLLGARWYAPEFGRFLTKDLISTRLLTSKDGSPLLTVEACNTYWYAMAGPVNYADPTGLQAQSVCLIDCTCWAGGQQGNPLWPVHCHCATDAGRVPGRGCRTIPAMYTKEGECWECRCNGQNTMGNCEACCEIYCLKKVTDPKKIHGCLTSCYVLKCSPPFGPNPFCR